MYTKVDELQILYSEYKSRLAESQDEAGETEIVEDLEIVEPVIRDTVSEYTRKVEIVPQKKKQDDDFQFLSDEEEKILAQTKRDLARYRKKIAQQRAAKRARLKAKKKAPVKKKKAPVKKSAAKAKSDRVRIPTMAHVKRKKVVNAFFDWPVDLSLFWLSSVYGPRKHPRGGKRFHYGIDLAALRGTPVMAAASGTVVQAQYMPGYGNNIIIKHNAKYKTRYAHLHKMFVKPGQKVKQGQKIGSVGATGYVRKSGKDASHLHFEIYADGRHVNPLKYLLNE